MNTVTILQRFIFLPSSSPPYSDSRRYDSLAIPIYADHGMAIKDSEGEQEIETKTKRCEDP
jgi:hypothetical protein